MTKRSDPVDLDLPWPNVRRSGFASGPPSRFNADVGWIRNGPFSAEVYGHGYRESARALVEAVTSETLNPNWAILPFAFLWRHHIELALKEIIRAGDQVSGTPAQLIEGHKLWQLWVLAKPHVVSVGLVDSTVLANVERALQEIHQIDPSGTNFRYAKNKTGLAPSLPNHLKLVNLVTMHESMEALANYLEGTIDLLRVDDEGV
jgi:hypothetical protein